MSEPILLIPGGKGQVGVEVSAQAAQYGFRPVPLDLPEFDLTDKTSVQAAFTEYTPDCVINCAAYTAVDKAESDQDTAYAVNCTATEHLATHCAHANIPFLHISTDYVFSGDKKGLYTELDETGPMAVYGTSKLAGEEILRQRWEKHIILRTAWVYGVHGNNFIKTMLRVGKERGALSVVNDQHGSPTNAGDIAETLLTIAAQLRAGKSDAYGTYHYTGDGVTTWHDFAAQIFSTLKDVENIEVGLTPITTADYPTPAKRPHNSALDCTKITHNFGIKPKDWRQRVDQTTRVILNNLKESST